MSTRQVSTGNKTAAHGQAPLIAADFAAYWLDGIQRTILFIGVMQQRSEDRAEHLAKEAPHVLKYECDLIADGRELARPVNYALVRVKPPAGIEIDERKRPFVIIDPRAGHGPGIGGFKADSEIGVAFRAGHPCYFIGFLPDPMPGQTIEDVVDAEAVFLERVSALHPQAEGKPAVVGNCQAGWAAMMIAARRPDLFGPLIVAGSPLSYWAGVRGQNPMRYTGGLLGGTWPAALLGDLGNGKFDGAWLVSNFENLNPANTFWTKHYNLYANIDKEAPRYLEFEQWWSGHVLLNAEEMQFIADELFVGNKLANGELAFSDGSRIDLRHIRSPIVVFCSKADNITPPPQALDWILDLYDDVEQIRAHGQTIVYAVHESAGHLGIFVSGAVAKKEHQEFASNIDLIDVLPPGLYEAVITPRDKNERSGDLIDGDYLVSFESRTLDDIRAYGGNSPADERRFAAVARLSEINLGLYRTFVQPWLRLWVNESSAAWLRRFQPLRLQYDMFSRGTPGALFAPDAAPFVETIRKNRHPVLKDNFFWQIQEAYARGIEGWLDAYREVRDNLSEALFDSIYGSPLTQSLAGLKPSAAPPRPRPGLDPTHQAFVVQRIEDLRRRLAEGGPREAAIRALLYIRMPGGTIDERGFRLMQRLRENAGAGLSLSTFKQVVRDQFFTLLIDERRAIEAIPAMLRRDANEAARFIKALRRIIEVVGLQSDAEKARFREIERLVEATREAQPLAQPETPKKRGVERKPMEPARPASGQDRLATAAGRKH